MANTRLFAPINRKKGPTDSRHFLGIPPELTDDKDHREKLPRPRVLVIEETSEGVFLFRFTEDGDFGGDTWHMNIDDAMYQAKQEYGDFLGEWKKLPEDVTDAVEFALSSISP